MGSTSGPNPGPAVSNPTTTPVAATTPAVGAPAAGTNPPAGTMPAALPIALKVSFTLNTPDGLRQISFSLEKDTDGAKVNWTITFILFERTDPTKPFGDAIVSLNVFVATALHPKAETAATQGLTPSQTAHAIGPAAEAAKQVQAGTMSHPVGANIIQNTLKS